jgi:hypothetical protein
VRTRYRGQVQITANYQANSWDLIANGTAGLTITLPVGPAEGDTVGVFNFANTPITISPGGLRIYTEGFQGTGGATISQAGITFREYVFDASTQVWVMAGGTMRIATGSFTYSLNAGQNYPSISAAQCGLSTIVCGYMTAWPNASWAGFTVNANQWNSASLSAAISTSGAQTCTIYWIAWGT